MQHQAVTRNGRGQRVQAVADDWVAQRGEMYAQLMAAAGDGCEPYSRALQECIACEHYEVRCRWFANCVINHLSRAVGPVANQWQIDCARVVRNQAARDGNVVLADRALFERATDRSLCVNATRKHHQAGGFHVETMDDQRIRKFSLYPSAQAVLFV